MFAAQIHPNACYTQPELYTKQHYEEPLEEAAFLQK